MILYVFVGQRTICESLLKLFSSLRCWLCMGLCVSIQEIEEQERLEAAGEPTNMKLGKLGKVGKGMKNRKAMVDTQPSPMGQRVVPRVDSAMKVKVEKAVAAKNKKEMKVRC